MDNKLDITEEQKQAFLNDVEEVEKKHGLQLCAVLHRVETQLKSSTEAHMAIRKLTTDE